MSASLVLGLCSCSNQSSPDAAGADSGGVGREAGDATGGGGAGSDAGTGQGAGSEAGNSQEADSGPSSGAGDAHGSSADGSPTADGSSAPDGGTACSGLFCEDFESGELNPSVWSQYQSMGQTITVETTTVAHGKYSAQFHALPNLASGDLIITKNAPAGLSGLNWGRAYVNVNPMPPAGHILLIIAGSDAFPMSKYLEVGSVNNGWQLSSQELNGVDSSGLASPGNNEAYSIGPAGGMPLTQWFCLEWEFNDTPDQITVFVNGQQSYAYTDISASWLGGTTTGQVGGFAQFGFGYYIWHPATYVFDMYYDDIVLDTKRVGCL